MEVFETLAYSQRLTKPVRPLAPAAPGVAISVAIGDPTNFLRVALVCRPLDTGRRFLLYSCPVPEQLFGRERIVRNRYLDAIDDAIDLFRATELSLACRNAMPMLVVTCSSRESSWNAEALIC